MAGLATTAGFITRHMTLCATYATGFNTDAPVVAPSWADSGGVGIAAFAGTVAGAADIFVR